MKQKFIIFSFIFTHFHFYSPLHAAQEIMLSLGEQQSLNASAGTKFSVGNPDVIHVKSVRLGEGNSVLVVRAKKQGYSDLVLFREGRTERMRFRVFTKQKGALLRDVKSALNGAEGIEILPNGNHWVVRGEAHSLEDHNLIEAFSRSNGADVLKLTHLSEAARKVAEARIREALDMANLQAVRVRGAGSQLWLEGTVLSQQEANLALGLAREIARSVESRIKVPFESVDTLRFKIRILELVKTTNDSIGMLWSNSVPGIISIHQKMFRGDFSLDSTLNILARSGKARILSEPLIAVNAQGIAEMQVGGEIPVQIRSKYTQHVQWKTYGLGLRIEVPGAADALVRTKLKVEVSSLDLANAIEGIPGIKLNRMETIVDLAANKTVFLSGLVQDQNSELETALPILGKIPVLGALFRSKEYQEHKTELVIAVTAMKDVREASR